MNYIESKRRKIEEDSKEVTRADEKDKNHVDLDKKEKMAKQERKRVSVYTSYLLTSIWLLTYVVISQSKDILTPPIFCLKSMFWFFFIRKANL